ncbi:hypothetical protein Q4I32_001894 [Leishmania shawi]|uniref:Uncharacterized protein n=2 Tax=Leishmania guyanensis species complex TaxID=38579 RepID=A0AAW3C5B4_9TRYP
MHPLNTTITNTILSNRGSGPHQLRSKAAGQHCRRHHSFCRHSPWKAKGRACRHSDHRTSGIFTYRHLTVAATAPTCMSDAHDSASAAQHHVFLSLPFTAIFHPLSVLPTLRRRRLPKLALSSAHMPSILPVSQGNGSGSSEALLLAHTSTPPTSFLPLGAEALRLFDMHSFNDNGSQPSSDPASEGVESHHRGVRTLQWLSEGALAAPAESPTANVLPSAPSHDDVSGLSDATDAAVRASHFFVPTAATTLASTESPARCVGVLSSPLPPAFALPIVLPATPLGKDNLSCPSHSYSCSMSIPSSQLAFSPFPHRLSTLRPTMVACDLAHGIEQEAVQRRHSQSALPNTVAHELLLSTGCTAEPAMSAVLSAARRNSSYISGTTMQGSFSITEDGVGGSDGGVTATAETPLMQFNTSRGTTFSGIVASTATTTASTTPYTSPSLTATRRCSSASALMEHTATFLNKNCISVNAGAAAAAEAALLSTPSQSPLCPPYAFSATASEMQSNGNEDNGEAAATAVSMAVGSAIPSVCRLLTAPATGARREHLFWCPSSSSDVNLQSRRTAEYDKAMRAVQRQEVWAEKTTAGREELRRQLEAHVFAKHHHWAERLCKDAPARQLLLTPSLPEQKLLSAEVVLISDDGKSSAHSTAAATAITIAGGIPPPPASFPPLIGTPLSFMGCGRDTATLPKVHVPRSTPSEAPGDEQDAASVGSPVEREDVESSAVDEEAGLTQPQWRPSRGEARDSALLPLDTPRSRVSVSSWGSSLSYEMALLAAARMSG